MTKKVKSKKCQKHKISIFGDDSYSDQNSPNKVVNFETPLLKKGLYDNVILSQNATHYCG